MVDQIADPGAWGLHAARPELKIVRSIVVADSILVMHFLKPMERPAELGRHHFDVLGDVAVLSRIRMLGVKDQNITSVDMPP